METHHLFAARGLPPLDVHPAGETREWCHGDTLAGYRRRGGHPVYGEHDVIYRFNSLGYRCPDFSVESDLRIVAIGCSYVFGVGVAQPHLFHERFAEKARSQTSKKVVLWNLAASGSSNDYISRLLYQALPLLDPHVVLVNFTHLARREYVSVENKLVRYLPSHTPSDEIEKEIYRQFKALSSPYDDQVNYFRNYKAVEYALAGRCWLYSLPEWHPLPSFMDRARFAGFLSSSVDKARDGEHPGPASHELLARAYWQRFVATGGPEALASR